MRKRTKVLSLLGFALCCLNTSANAILITGPINLTLSESDPIGQTDQGACIIGDPSCGNVGGTINGTFTLLDPTQGQTGDYLDIFSPEYTIADVIAAAGGSIFSIGIDINQANSPNIGPHELLAFVANVNGGDQEFAFDGTSTTSTFGGTPLDPLNNPGNGFSDWQIGVFDLSSFAPSDTITFGIDVLNVSGGRDQFFLLDGVSPPPVAVPEPSSIALMGMGLLVLGVGRRRLRSFQKAS